MEYLIQKAHVRKRITIDDVINSPVVASPLKLYDCCPFSDGASAVILVMKNLPSTLVDHIWKLLVLEEVLHLRCSGRADITTIPR